MIIYISYYYNVKDYWNLYLFLKVNCFYSSFVIIIIITNAME